MLCSDTICFWIAYSSFEWLLLNCAANFAIFPDEALLELAAATNEHRFYTQNTFSKKILVVGRLKGRIINNMLQ